MINWETNRLELKMVNSEQMPFMFKGTYTGEKSIKIKLTSSCGCTEAVLKKIKDNKLFPPIEVKELNPNDKFTIEGFLKKRKALGLHEKSIKVEGYIEDKLILTEVIKLAMNVI